MGSIPELRDSFANGRIGLTIDMAQATLSGDGPGEDQQSPRTDMAVDCLKKWRLILGRDMLSDLETDNTVNGGSDKARVGEICNGAIRKGSRQWIPVVAKGLNPSLTECLDIVTQSAPEVIEGTNPFLAHQISNRCGKRGVECVLVFDIDIHPEARV
jgi:hypothetical protein